MADDTSNEIDEEGVFDPKVKWMIPEKLNSVTFIGKDVVAVAHDTYMSFLNVRTHAELVYAADCSERGDGVDLVAGHRTQVFAFAEKINNARIFLVLYPSFQILAKLKEPQVNRYKAVHIMEGDLVCGFSGFPNFVLAVWNWRTLGHLLTVPTGLARQGQIYAVSRTQPWACQCGGGYVAVWEVSPAFRRCLALRRASPPPPPDPAPDLVAIAWALDGGLYGIDADAHLYGVVCDGINMVTALEWDEEVAGPNQPKMCAFGAGFLVFGPDYQLRWVVQAERTWAVRWQAALPQQQSAARLLASTAADHALLWTGAGHIYRLALPDDQQSLPQLQFVTFKQRSIVKIEMIAPKFEHLVTLSECGVLCVYHAASGRPVLVQPVGGRDVTLAGSPAGPQLAVTAQRAPADRARASYGVAVLRWSEPVPEDRPTPERAPAGGTLHKASALCLTRQIVSRAVFSPDGCFLMVAAMSAGHVFILRVDKDCQLSLVRTAETGRGLADCTLMRVSGLMRAFSLVLVSDKYAIGERIVCINAESGKDNKFAGKMQGPYARLIPLGGADTMLALPHQLKQFHKLRLAGDRGTTVSVRVEAVIETGHELRSFGAFCNAGGLYTYGMDGYVIKRTSDGAKNYEWRVVSAHRYSGGVAQVAADARGRLLGALSASGHLVLVTRHPRDAPAPPPPHPALLLTEPLHVVLEGDKNLEELEEEAAVRAEAAECRARRDDVIAVFKALQAQVLELLEENIAEVPLHQLCLSEFNLHLEAKKERLKQAEKEREEIRLTTEALIRAQDKVTAWIKQTCWDTMATPRVKLLGIFTHYQVENYAVLGQRDHTAQATRAIALRTLEMDNDHDLFHACNPYFMERLSCKKKEEVSEAADADMEVRTDGGRSSEDSESAAAALLLPDRPGGALAHSAALRYIAMPPHTVPQTRLFSFVHMDDRQHFLKLNVQNLRLWFNDRFDDLMIQKRREVGLVMERNARLRFIVDELNKLSDLRGSFHHLIVPIKDPEWAQEEEPHKLIKVEPEECTIPPYISPSQIVVPPPEPKPKDDFRERALNEMMDGVLEKLWHEEIKKPIPMPQCMLDKDPEKFTEEDLKQVFEYERKVEARCAERDKYRKMLHAEYAALARLADEGIVKFNVKVKEMWLTKLRVDSVIAQENLLLMRLRRVNLDRVEAAEQVEEIRAEMAALEAELEALQRELRLLQDQADECQRAYDALAQRDRFMDRTFKNHFADLSQMVVDICYKFFRKRPKWQQRATMTPSVLYDMASAVQSGTRPPLLHADVQDYVRTLEQYDQITNMPPIMDESQWSLVCRLRRAKVENEIRMRAVVLEAGLVEGAAGAWGRAGAARRGRLAGAAARMAALRRRHEHAVRNVALQLVLPAGQVEIPTTGHMADFQDAILIPRDDIESINNLILRVGELKLAMMRKQMEFRKGILAKEWQHAQMKMRLRHMKAELYSYTRLKIPKELQLFLKNKEKGYTDETEYQRLEKEMAATKKSFERALAEHMARVEDMAARLGRAREARQALDAALAALTVHVSERRLRRAPAAQRALQALAARRMRSLVERARLVRHVQRAHTAILLLDTELELLRLRTFPTITSTKRP